MTEPTLEELRDLRERALSHVHAATVASEAAAAASELGTIERAIAKITGEQPGPTDPLTRAASDHELLEGYRRLSPNEQAALTRDSPDRWTRVMEAREREGLRKLFGGL